MTRECAIGNRQRIPGPEPAQYVAPSRLKRNDPVGVDRSEPVIDDGVKHRSRPHVVLGYEAQDVVDLSYSVPGDG
jgi:hypothetical protein